MSLRKKAIKSYVNDITKNGIMSNKNFLNIVKPFITNKSGLANNNITIIQNNETITDDKQLTKLFNHYYVNIVEKSSGVEPTSLSDIKTNLDIISHILAKHKDHPSVTKIMIYKTNNEITFMKLKKML